MIILYFITVVAEHSATVCRIGFSSYYSLEFDRNRKPWYDYSSKGGASFLTKTCSVVELKDIANATGASVSTISVDAHLVAWILLAFINVCSNKRNGRSK